MISLRSKGFAQRRHALTPSCGFDNPLEFITLPVHGLRACRVPYGLRANRVHLGTYVLKAWAAFFPIEEPNASLGDGLLFASDNRGE